MQPGKSMLAYAVANNKGGTGKTTSAVSLAHAMARQGRYTLLIDNDPQGHVGASLGEDPEDRPGTYELYMEDGLVDDLVVRTRNHLDVILADRSLSAAESELRGLEGYRYTLSDKAQALSLWDALIVDCSPSLSPLTICAFQLIRTLIDGGRADGGLLVPIELTALSIQGAVEQEDTLAQLDDGWVPPLAGVIPTKYDQRKRIENEYLEDLKGVYEGMVTPPVRTSVRFQEAPSHGQTIYEYDPGGRGAEDYDRIVRFLTD